MTINKQILHIVVEIIVISGVIIYFSYKHKKLVTRVEELSKQLEIQNEIIQKHEQIINQLIMSIQSAGSNKVNYQRYTEDDNECKPKKINKDSNVSKKITKQKILITKQEEEEEEEQEDEEVEEVEEVEKQVLKNKQRSVSNVSFNKKPQIYEYTGDTSSDHDSELDTEIASELNELEEGLKKKN